MAPHDRPSPRSCIRDWLLQIESKAVNEEISTQPPEQHGKARNLSHSQGRRRFEGGSRWHDPKQSKHINRETNRKSTDAMCQEAESSEPNDENGPQRLGLHAPFRSFGRERDDMDRGVDMANSTPKRKRRLSSISSYLEPARFVAHTGAEAEDQVQPMVSFSRGSVANSVDTASRSSSVSLDSSTVISVSPEKPAKSYERRPRHKTRGDRYEIKQAKETKKRKKEKIEKKAKKAHAAKKDRKRNRGEKSGAALMHNFTARNVTRDRLTLRPASTVGLFSKGRASSPVKRRGLPDLAFSEMTFLNYRRERPDDITKPAVKKARRKKDKAADAEAEISRYFTSNKASAHNAILPCAMPTENELETSRYGDRGRISDKGNTTLPMVDLPEKPFLGFGSSRIDIILSPPGKAGSKGDQAQSRALSTPTSYVSWSMSGARSHHSPRPQNAAKFPSRSPRKNEHARVSLGEVPIAESEPHHLDRDPVRGSADINTSHSHQLQPHDPVPDLGAETTLDGGGDKIPPRVIRKDFTHDEAFDQPISSSEKIENRQPPTDYQSTVDSVNEALLSESSLALAGSLNHLPEQTMSVSFDAALEEFLQKCNPVGRKSSHISAYHKPTHGVYKSKKPSFIDCDNLAEPNQVNKRLPVSNNDCIQIGSDNPGSHHGSLKPPSLPSTRAFDYKDGQVDKYSEFNLLEQGCQKKKGVTLSTQNQRPRHDESHNDVATSNAWSSYNGIYQQQLEPASCNLGTSQAYEQVYVSTEFGKGDFKVSDNHADSSSFERGGYDGYGDLDPYDLNGSVIGLGKPLDTYHEESPGSPLHDAANLPSYHTFAEERNLEMHPFVNESVLHQNLYSENYIRPEDSYPCLPHYDPGAFERPGMNDEYRHEPYQLELPDILQRRPLRSLHEAQVDAQYMPDNQPCQDDDAALPGFWKPHKLY